MCCSDLTSVEAYKCIQAACHQRCEEWVSASRPACRWSAARHEHGVHASREAPSGPVDCCVYFRSDLEKIAPQWLALSPVVRRFFTVTYPEVSKAALAIPPVIGSKITNTPIVLGTHARKQAKPCLRPWKRPGCAA